MQGGGSVRPASARHAARRNNPGNTPAVEACSPSGGGGWSRRQALRFEDEAWSIPFDQLLSSTDAYVDDGSARVSAYPEMPSTVSPEASVYPCTASFGNLVNRHMQSKAWSARSLKFRAVEGRMLDDKPESVCTAKRGLRVGALTRSGRYLCVRD